MLAQRISITKNGDGYFHDYNHSMKFQLITPDTIPDERKPHNINAERVVLGSLEIDPDAILEVSDIIKPNMFFIEKHTWIYEAMLSLHEKGLPIDLTTLSEELEIMGRLEDIGGSAYLAGLSAEVPTSLHAKYYAKIVRDKSFFRGGIRTAEKIAELAYSGTDATEVSDEIEAMVFELTQRFEDREGLQPISEGLKDYNEQLEAICENPGSVIGIPTGLTDLDRLLGGLIDGDMIVLAGRPGMGKTSLALNIGGQAARKYRKKVALFSLEMTERELIGKLISAESGIDSQRLKLGQIKEDEWQAFYAANRVLAEAPIHIDDTPAISVFELRSKARKLAAKQGLDLLIVDYLQLMRGASKEENRQQEISFISRSIKGLAKELQIPILALSQLSRQCESRNDKRPILSDLRESGSIEQDADVCVFIYRDDIYNPDTEFPNIAEILVRKHRSGPTGNFSTYFKARTTQFVDLEVRTTPLEY